MPDPEFSLTLTRHIDAPLDTVWQIMTERLVEWWCPRPWRTDIIEPGWSAVAAQLAELAEAEAVGA